MFKPQARVKSGAQKRHEKISRVPGERAARLHFRDALDKVNQVRRKERERHKRNSCRPSDILANPPSLKNKKMQKKGRGNGNKNQMGQHSKDASQSCYQKRPRFSFLQE